MLGRYNLTPANRKNLKSEAYEFGGAFFGSMTALMGAGVTIDIERNMVSSMNAGAELRFGFDAHMFAESALSATTAVGFAVYKKEDFASECSANMQRVLNEPVRMNSETEAMLELRMQIMPGWELHEDLSALWNSVQTKETVMRFKDIRIPPGGVVVIDSEFFTATLDEENIVDLYEGDWLMIGSRLMAVEVKGTSSGKLDVELLYREMYL